MKLPIDEIVGQMPEVLRRIAPGLLVRFKETSDPLPGHVYSGNPECHITVKNCILRPAGEGMHNFIKHFIREGPGRWYCFEPATLDTPVGRIQVNAGTVFTRGTKFMNFDIAAALDEQYDKDPSAIP